MSESLGAPICCRVVVQKRTDLFALRMTPNSTPRKKKVTNPARAANISLIISLTENKNKPRNNDGKNTIPQTCNDTKVVIYNIAVYKASTMTIGCHCFVSSSGFGPSPSPCGLDGSVWSTCRHLPSPRCAINTYARTRSGTTIDDG